MTSNANFSGAINAASETLVDPMIAV